MAVRQNLRIIDGDGLFHFSLLSGVFWSATVSAQANSHIIILGLVTLTVRMMQRII